MITLPILLAGGAVFLAAMLFFTSPDQMPAVLLIVPFLLIFALLSGVGMLMLRYAGRTSKRSKRLVILCAAVPVILLVMQSIGQLTPRDVVTIFALAALGYFYASRLVADA